MLFSRNAEKQLIDWKDAPNRKPLIIRGARQVGKTTLVQKFASIYKKFISLNLEKEKDKNFFELYDNVHDIVDALFLDQNIEATELNNTLLFIDEIQESPKAIAFLRYFFEEIPLLHVICAGSLLEFAIKNVKNFPVGRVSFLYLHPFNFQEYLAANEKILLLEKLKSVPVKATAHSSLMENFHRYAMIGGMPEIIQNDFTLKKISNLSSVYESVLETYKSDVVKYSRGNTERSVIKYIVDNAASFIDKRIIFQGFGNSNYKSREVGEAFRALDASKFIQIIYPTTDTTPPLNPNLRKSPKIQFLDTGLVNYSLGIQSEMLSMKDFNDAYNGSIIPHLIFQELISLQVETNKRSYFWVREKKQSSAEVDLIYTYKNLAIPVEIKSGAAGKLKSLHQFIEAVDHPYAIRMYAGALQIERAITPGKKPYLLMNLPYYLGTMMPEYVDWFIKNHPL